MSASTVLKNSAQLCSRWYKQTQNGWAGDQKNKLKRMNAHSWNIQTAVGTCRSFCSCAKQNIWEPTMLAQDCRVNTVRMKGSVSPCRCTMDAIWITGSLSASGKIPVAGRDPDGETLRLLFSAKATRSQRDTARRRLTNHHLSFRRTRCQSSAPGAVRSSATRPLQDDLSSLSSPRPPRTDTRKPAGQTQ